MPFNARLKRCLQISYSVIVQHPLPLTPSSPRRRLYEPEAPRGGGIFVDDINIFPPPCRGRVRVGVNDYHILKEEKNEHL